MLSAFFCISLLAAAPLRAEDAGLAGAPPPSTDSAPVEQVPAPGGPAQGGSDLDVFRLNTADNPLDSVGALLRLLPPKTKPQIEEFKAEHSYRLSELMFSLHKAYKDNQLSREEYLEVTLSLAPFQLRTIQGRTTGPGSTAPGGGHRRDLVDTLTDVRVAAASGDSQKAEETLRAAVKEYPQNPGVHTTAASYYNEARDYKAAERAATTALGLNDTDPDAYKARALARASLDDRKGAIEDIKKAMSADPQDESARVLSALLESRKAVPTLRSISSVDEMRRALGDSGDAPDAVKGSRGSALGSLAGAGGTEAAAAPDFARSKAYLKTAVAKNRLGDYAGAARYAGLAIEKDPGNFEAYLERANANNFLGLYDEAVRDAGHVIERDPGNLQAFNMRAWSLNRKGKSDAAAADASRAIGINPGFADAWFNRALAYEKQGDYKRMLEDFRQAAALSGAYSRRYQDAVSQYGPRVPGFSPAGQFKAAGAAEPGSAPAKDGAPMKRFLTLLFFTLTGGALVAAGLVHIMTSRTPGPQAARATHPDVLSPSVFYEGVATGKYKIERKLGEGAMGVVYEATDQSLGRKVAIKKMGDEIKVNEREKQRFLEEARTVALLHHPGVIEIYTIFEEEDNIYLVFEHVDGQTLDKVLDKEARIPFDRARRMFSEAAGALVYAHSKNVVHRDLKLANIMLSSDGGVKVMDFGLAYRARETMARMSGGEVVGSPAYMAPEQELGASSVQSDIYSLGVCLYEAVSGVLPFQGPDFHYQKTHRKYQKLTDTVPGLPAEVDAIVERCLEPDPEKRYTSAEDLRRDLDALA